MPIPNRYPSKCHDCRTSVQPEEGLSARRAGDKAWCTFCHPCAGKRNLTLAPKKPQDLDVALRDDGHISLTLSKPMGEKFAIYKKICEQHGAKFDGVQRCNFVAIENAFATLGALQAQGFWADVTSEVIEACAKHAARIDQDQASAWTRLEVIKARLEALGQRLYPYQQTGVEWLATRDRALLCDEMGLGKTIQALTALPHSSPVLIVCPSIAKGVWVAEARKWRPDLSPTLLEGKGSFRWPTHQEMVVTNFDVLPTAPEFPPPGVCLVVDEAHALKSNKSLRTQRLRLMADDVRQKGGRTWLLTATPLLNRPPELWSLLQCAGLAQEAFGSWKGFSQAFNAKEKQTRDGKKWLEWGAPSETVQPAFAKVALRRLRKDVLPELPTKTYQDHFVDLKRKEEKAIDQTLLEDANMDRSWQAVLEAQELSDIGFEGLSKARALLAEAKIAAMLAMVEEFEEQGEPLVVFSAHDAPIQALAGRVGWLTITGETTSAKRQQRASAFQNSEEITWGESAPGNEGPPMGIAGNIQAMGTAITLTRASHVLFVDQAWTPALNWQAEDRICRIGQTRGCVVHRLVADHPLDRRVAELLGQKTSMVEGAIR